MRFAIVFGAMLAFSGCQSEDCSVNSKSNMPASTVLDSPNSIEPVESQDKVASELKTVSITVTGMMCPHGCYPEVKSLIAKKNDIESIELAPQITKDAIDNPIVLVKYRGILDKDGTTKAIMDAGFEKVDFVDQ